MSEQDKPYGLEFARAMLERIAEFESSGQPMPFHAFIIFDKDTVTAYPSSNMQDTASFVAAMHASIAWKQLHSFVPNPLVQEQRPCAESER